MDKFLIGDFEGPLDLILHLIKKSKMEIFDIEINEITEHIVDNIAYNFPNKEELEIRLLNNVDLSSNHKYIKKVYSEKLTTYTCKNNYKDTAIKRTLVKKQY